jgi:hypothetical protein
LLVNLEQAIHARWAATPSLESLLPAQRLRTGAFHGKGRPYATLERKTSRTAFRTNAGDALDEVALSIHVWHDSCDAGRAIVHEIQAAFDRSDFDLGGGDRVVQMRRTADTAKQHDDNVWQFTVEFSVSVYLSSGI